MAPIRLIFGVIAGLMIAPPAFAAPAASPYGALGSVAAPSAPDRIAFQIIAAQEAARARLPYDLVDAVMKIESDYQPGRIGDVGEIGLMQVRPDTAAMLGFRGDVRALADPIVNIHYGSTYLGRAWRLAGGNVCRTLMKYRAGHGAETMSALSASYCARAKAHLVAMNSPLAQGIKPSDLVADISADTAPSPTSRPTTHGFWTAFQARIRHIDAKLEAKWRRVASR